MGNEGERRDFRRLQATADADLESRSNGSAGGRHEAQRNGAVEAGGEAAGGDAADGEAGGIEDFGAVAGRRAVDEQADADAAQLAAELAEDAIGAGEVAGLAAARGLPVEEVAALTAANARRIFASW